MRRLGDAIRAAVSLRATAEADGVQWDSRKSRPTRGDWWACCPFHAEKSPSFHVVEPGGADGFFRCFGCGAKGSVIDYVMQRRGCDALAAMKDLSDGRDLGDVAPPKTGAQLRAEDARAAKIAQREGERAVAMWKAAQPGGALVARYLAARGVETAALRRAFGWPDGVPPSLRLEPAAPYWIAPEEQTPGAPVLKRIKLRDGEELIAQHVGPAMLAAVGRGRLLGVHRTWITPTGRARGPDGLKLAKRWRGVRGRMIAAPIAFGPPAPRMVVGEGVETTLAAFAQLCGDDPALWTADAAKSLDAMRQAHRPPDGVAHVMLLGEGRPRDPDRARRELAQIAARYRALDLSVELAAPLDGPADGRDFADHAATP